MFLFKEAAVLQLAVVAHLDCRPLGFMVVAGLPKMVVAMERALENSSCFWKYIHEGISFLPTGGFLLYQFFESRALVEGTAWVWRGSKYVAVLLVDPSCRYWLLISG